MSYIHLIKKSVWAFTRNCGNRLHHKLLLTLARGILPCCQLCRSTKRTFGGVGAAVSEMRKKILTQ